MVAGFWDWLGSAFYETKDLAQLFVDVAHAAGVAPVDAVRFGLGHVFNHVAQAVNQSQRLGVAGGVYDCC